MQKIFRNKWILLAFLLSPIILAVMLLLILSLRNKVGLIDDQNLSVKQIGYEILNNTGGSRTSRELIENIRNQITREFGDVVDESQIPISYGGIPILPDKYREMLIDKMARVSNYEEVYSIKSKGEWKVYNVEGTDFREFYRSYSDSPNYKSNVKLFLVDKYNKKFISIISRVNPEDELNFLETLIKIYESSEFYQFYPHLLTLNLEPNKEFGFELQFTFDSLYSHYKSVIREGRAFHINRKWEIDYEGSKSYKKFIEKQVVEKNSKAAETKEFLLERNKKYE